MKATSKKAVGALALLASAALVLSGCSSSSDSSDSKDTKSEGSSEALRIGTLLPQTGSLEHLIYGPQAAVKLAISEINDAGGVLGKDVEVVVEANEHDPTDPTIMAKSVDEIIKAKPAFVLGAMGTGNTNAAMPKLTEAGILMGSPSNTGIALAGINKLYFRTIASDIIQGRALGNLILKDGNAKVAVLTQNNDYGKGLRDNLQSTLEDGGAEVTYGAKGKGEEFPEAQTAFASEVTAALATKPDAVAMVSYVEAKQAIPELAAQGFDLSKLYLVDGNAVPYPEFDAGLLEGAQATTPGRIADKEFKAALEKASPDVSKSLNFAPEAYDAVMLVALAAEQGGATDTETIVKNLHSVSGSEGGDDCDTFKTCAALIKDGKKIHYKGQAGGGPLNKDNEPSTALIGLYKYDNKNNPVAVGEIEG
ncbi:amino acid ABC transporter substrate-binding protein [Leucobacter viscericola]|uniref:Amino acid ABC transporter substrate-binding protein n=1 Tax=Leucobacter viscericola TaxID=2714935 RepID=A0A6G7XCA0_9MICO|nr:ABC transporter substrate-binding protein [Leucobacter viscericola]QIK62132.1 amino acid ABC transporter substrate-binding protein [Leucobacter viscericola]